MLGVPRDWCATVTLDRATGLGWAGGYVGSGVATDGYAASAQASPVTGEQLCQHHCPVAHVAEQFPQLCEAETEAFARLLDTHVQRIATIAHGEGVCTTHIPRGGSATESTGKTERISQI